MANNDISKYYKKVVKNASGSLTYTTITDDSYYVSAPAKTVVEKSDGRRYIKNSSFNNVFDSYNTYSDYLLPSDISVSTVGSGNAVAGITYTSSTNPSHGTITQTLAKVLDNNNFSTYCSSTNSIEGSAVTSISWNKTTERLEYVKGRFVNRDALNVSVTGSGNAVTDVVWDKENTKLTFKKDIEFIKKSEFADYFNNNFYYSVTISDFTSGNNYSGSSIRNSSGWISGNTPTSGTYRCIMCICLDYHAMFACGCDVSSLRKLSLFIKVL